MIQENKYTSKFVDYLYFIWGLFVLFQQTVNYSFLGENTIIKTINVITMVALIVYELVILREIDFKVSIISLCCIILFLIMGILASYHQYGLTFFVAFLFIIAGNNVKIDEILKPFLWFSGLVLIGTIILNKFGKIPNFYMFGDDRVRSSLGFGYYTFASQIAFYFTIAYLVYKNKKIKYIELFLLAVLNIYVYYYTDTRSPYLLISLLLVYSLLKKIFNFKGIVYTTIGKWLISCSFILSFVCLYWLTFKSPTSVFMKFNNALSGRLSLNVSAFQNWGVHLLGQKIEFTTINAFGRTSANYNYVDSSYFQNLIVNGWLFTAIIILSFTFLCIKTVKEKNDILAVSLMIIAIHAMFDPQLIWPWFSPFVLLVGSLFPLTKELNKGDTNNNNRLHRYKEI